MFLAETKTVVTKAMQTVFGPSYPVGDFQNLWVSIEFPDDIQNYPGVWVSFEVQGNIERGGVDNQFRPPPPSYVANGAPAPPIYLWRAKGVASYTLAAMTSLQRDRLFDEVCKVVTASRDPAHSSFRALIEDNPLIAIRFDFDQIMVSSITENAGTPWQTMDMIYEATVSMQAEIEFYSDTPTSELVPLRHVEVIATGGPPFDVTVPRSS